MNRRSAVALVLAAALAACETWDSEMAVDDPALAAVDVACVRQSIEATDGVQNVRVSSQTTQLLSVLYDGAGTPNIELRLIQGPGRLRIRQRQTIRDASTNSAAEALMRRVAQQAAGQCGVHYVPGQGRAGL